ncbi:MAG: hypothetical protein Fur0024_4580 [Patescibacteria group bacterium]
MQDKRFIVFEQELLKQFVIIASKFLKKIDSTSFLSPVRIKLSKDVSFADIFISIFPDKTEKKNFLLLRDRLKEIQGELFRRMAGRKFPEIRVHLDDSIEYEDKISTILKNAGSLD